jgi:hypothetical protein
MSEDTTLDQELVTEQKSDPAQETPSSESFGKLVYEAKKHRQEKAKLREELEVLKAETKERDELELKKKEEYKELSERLSLERDEYKVKADEFDNFQKDTRSNLLNGLSDEQKVIAEELSISKLQKFVDLNKARPVATQESTSTKMALEKDAWKDMDQKDRRKNWNTIVETYKNKS